MNKLAITIWNYKGGVGKTTISLVLAEIAAQRGLKVLALDLDDQQNLSDMLRLSAKIYPQIEIRQKLNYEYADEDFDVFILDTHPSKGDTVMNALKFADIVLIPVLGDYQSFINLRSVIEYVQAAGLGAGQVALVKNCMTDLQISREVESALDEAGYNIAGRLPRNNILVRNIATGEKWDKGMREVQRVPFEELYANIMRAYQGMLAGEFHQVWR